MSADHCRRSLHTFNPRPSNRVIVVGLCPKCQGETHPGDHVVTHTLECPDRARYSAADDREYLAWLVRRDVAVNSPSSPSVSVRAY